MSDFNAAQFLLGLDRALRAAGVPIVGVSLSPGDVLPAIVQYDQAATAPQRTQGDAIVAGFGSTPRVPRTLLAIRADLAALTAGQKTAVWTDITSGNPPKWATDAGPNAAAIAVLTLLGASATLSAADVLEAKLRGVAMYCQDVPGYLVHPAFDGTINVAGDQPA